MNSERADDMTTDDLRKAAEVLTIANKLIELISIEDNASAYAMSCRIAEIAEELLGPNVTEGIEKLRRLHPIHDTAH